MRTSRLVALLHIFMLAITVFGQSAPGAQPEAITIIDNPSAQFPERFTECEGTKCESGYYGTWRFHDRTGSGIWQYGGVAKLEVTAFDGTSVEIHRTDLPDSGTYGLTAVYRGTVEGPHFRGTVSMTWPGHSIIHNWKADAEAPNEDPEVAGWEFNCAGVPGHPGLVNVPLKAANYFREQKNNEQYFCWTQTAAIMDEDPLAAYLLAAMYGGGIGTAHDPKRAWKWAQFAGQRGRPLPLDVTMELAREAVESGGVVISKEDMARGVALLGGLLDVMSAEPKMHDVTTCNGHGCSTSRVPDN